MDYSKRYRAWAARFIPFTAVRSVVKWDEKKAEKKLSVGAKLQKKQQSNLIAIEFLKYVSPVDVQNHLFDLSEEYDV